MARKAFCPRQGGSDLLQSLNLQRLVQSLLSSRLSPHIGADASQHMSPTPSTLLQTAHSHHQTQQPPPAQHR